MPTYNRADGYLPEALESALAQTYAPLEILVSDNCSTDGTAELVGSYDDPRIRCVRHETNLGAQGNFDYCLDAARGDFFLMLHDDDRMDPDLVEVCINALEGRRGVGYVRTGNRLLDGEGGVRRERPNGAAGATGVEALLAWMRSENYWALSSTLYETAALRDIGGFPTSKFPLTFDCHATAQLALQYGGLELEVPKASFRIHEGELSHKMAPVEWIEEWKRLFEAVLTWAPTEHDRRALEKQGNVFFSMLCYQFAAKIESWRLRMAVHISLAVEFRQLPPSLTNRVRAWRMNLLPRSSKGSALAQEDV
jgi:glycosyltransferase involved in cell wall biosynthesis